MKFRADWSQGMHSITRHTILGLPVCYPKILKIKLYRIIISHAVLYGCETWSSTLREKHRLWVFENRVLKKIPGPKRNQVTEEWKRLCNEEPYGLYSIPPITGWSNQEEWNGQGMYGGQERCIQDSDEETWGKSPHARPRNRWEDKTDLHEVGSVAEARLSWCGIGTGSKLLWLQ